MFRKITSLFFGGDEETSEENQSETSTKDTPEKDPNRKISKPADTDDEWLLVSHHEGELSTVADLAVELANTHVNRCTCVPPVPEEPEASLATDVRASEPELSALAGSSPSRGLRGSLSQAGALAKVTQLARVQRAQAQATRHQLGWNGMQRQNCVRHRAQPHHVQKCTTHLQQPGNRK